MKDNYRYRNQCLCRAMISRPRSTGTLHQKTLLRVIKTVRRSWLKLAKELQKRNWPSPDTQISLRMLGCPSPHLGQGDENRGWFCRRRHVCPFCWARMITLPAWFQLRGSYESLRATNSGLMVIRFEHREFYPMDNHPASDPNWVVAKIKDANERRKEVRAIRGLGAFVCHRVIPYLRTNCIGFYRAGIVLGGAIPAKPIPNTEMEICVDPPLSDLLAWVADVTRYPLPFLETDPGTIVTLLRAMDHVRLTATYGVVRKGKT